MGLLHSPEERTTLAEGVAVVWGEAELARVGELERGGQAVGQMTPVQQSGGHETQQSAPTVAFSQGHLSDSLGMWAQGKFLRHKGDPVRVLAGAEPDRSQVRRTRICSHSCPPKSRAGSLSVTPAFSLLPILG